MSLFHRVTEPVPSRPEPATVSSGWLHSPEGRRSAVSIVAEVDRLLVFRHYVPEDGRPAREVVYEGRSLREAVRVGNDVLHTMRLRGFRARQPGSSDASFGAGDVSQRLGVALL